METGGLRRGVKIVYQVDTVTLKEGTEVTPYRFVFSSRVERSLVKRICSF